MRLARLAPLLLVAGCHHAATAPPTIDAALGADLAWSADLSMPPDLLLPPDLTTPPDLTPACFVALPDPLVFLGAKVGTASDPMSVVLRNRCSTRVTVVSVLVAGQDAADFGVLPPMLPVVLGTSEQMSAPVIFAPQAPGKRSATLAVTARGAPSLKVGLTGTGF